MASTLTLGVECPRYVNRLNLRNSETNKIIFFVLKIFYVASLTCSKVHDCRPGKKYSTEWWLAPMQLIGQLIHNLCSMTSMLTPDFEWSTLCQYK